jgi:hypothetical protein
VTRLFKAGARLVARLVPEADADAVCGYWTASCGCRQQCNQIGQCWRNIWRQDCGWCSDGSSYCGACYETSLSC